MMFNFFLKKNVIFINLKLIKVYLYGRNPTLSLECMIFVHVIYQTRVTVFHWIYPNTEKRVENTTRSGVFLTKFEVFG